MIEVALILFGPRVCTFVADNLEGAHIDQMAQKLSFSYEYHKYRRNVRYIAELYHTLKERIGLQEKIKYTKIENEIAIEPNHEYDQRFKIVWSYCGLKENHVGYDEGAYAKLVEGMGKSQPATNAMVIMINPLHVSLPRVVLHLQATCNRFTHETVLR